jgi:ABC-type sugar transport system permease subunit
MKKTVLEQEALIGWVLILPALTLITGLSLYPLLYNLYLSFFHASLSEKNSFIGLNNYKYILLDPVFWRSLGVTLLYTTGTTLGTTLMGIGTALLLNKPFPGRRLVRALVILPYAAPLISEVFSWQFLFDPVNGIFIDILVEKTGILSTVLTFWLRLLSFLLFYSASGGISPSLHFLFSHGFRLLTEIFMMPPGLMELAGGSSSAILSCRRYSLSPQP